MSYEDFYMDAMMDSYERGLEKGQEMSSSYQQMLKEQFLKGEIAIITALPQQRIDIFNFAKRCGLNTKNASMSRCFYVSSERLLSIDSITFAKQQTKNVVLYEDCDFLHFSFSNQTPLYGKNCVVDYANKLMDYILAERCSNPHFDISDILSYIEKSKYEYQPAEHIFTGHYDTNGVPIYVGDTVKEGRSGRVSKVVIDYDRHGYWLEGLGEGYGIENAETKWECLAPLSLAISQSKILEVQEPSIYSQMFEEKTFLEEEPEKEV